MNKLIPIVLGIVIGFAVVFAPSCATKAEKEQAAEAQATILEAEAKNDELAAENEKLIAAAQEAKSEEARIAKQIEAADAMWKSLAMSAITADPEQRKIIDQQMDVVMANAEGLRQGAANAAAMATKYLAIGDDVKRQVEANARLILAKEAELESIAASVEQRASFASGAIKTIGGLATNAGVPFAGVGVSLLEGALGLAATSGGLAWWNQRKKTVANHEALRAAVAAIATVPPDAKAAVLAKLDEQATDDDHKVLRGVVALDSLPPLKIAA